MLQRTRLLCLVTLGLIAALLPHGAEAVVAPVAVVTGPQDQWQGFANETWLAWTANSVQHPNHWNTLVRPLAGGTKGRVNPSGTFGFTGNFDPGTDHLIYQQVTSSNSAIFFYDAATGQQWRVQGVNTRKWEWQPRVSNAFILFQRDHRVNKKAYTDVLLYDRATHQTRKLGTWRSAGKVFRTGNVGERYATFFVGTKTAFFPYLYDSQTGIRTRITSTQPWTWGPVVDETNGTVYFAASGNACGGNSNIWRLPISLTGSPTKIVDMPNGVDIGWVMSLAPNPVLGLDLLFYRLVCSKHQGDIFKAPQVDQVP
jgi:hypothetical protein